MKRHVLLTALVAAATVVLQAAIDGALRARPTALDVNAVSTGSPYECVTDL